MSWLVTLSEIGAIEYLKRVGFTSRKTILFQSLIFAAGQVCQPLIFLAKHIDNMFHLQSAIFLSYFSCSRERQDCIYVFVENENFYLQFFRTYGLWLFTLPDANWIITGINSLPGKLIDNLE